jgi:large subunit ribosomal protein L21
MSNFSYAIIESGGKQYRVSEGDLIDVECQSGEVGQLLSFNEVLLVGNQETIHLGTPLLSGARVVGTIAEQGKKDKVIVFKFKRRKKYRKKQGHRQRFTKVRIDQIELTAKKVPGSETEKVKETASKAVAKPEAVKEAAAKKAPSKTVKKKVSKAPKKQAAKAPKKTATRAAPEKGASTAQKSKAKVVKKKATKGVKKTTKKTTKKSTKKTVQKKD